MEYIFQYPSDRLMCSKASESRKCAVELTGRNSVRPSTMPRITDSKYGFNRPPRKIGKLVSQKYWMEGLRALIGALWSLADKGSDTRVQQGVEHADHGPQSIEILSADFDLPEDRQDGRGTKNQKHQHDRGAAGERRLRIGEQLVRHKGGGDRKAQ